MTFPLHHSRQRRRQCCSLRSRSYYHHGLLLVICGSMGLYLQLQSITHNSLDFGSSYYNIASLSFALRRTNTVNNNSNNQQWKLMAFPYKTLGSGTDMQCQWKTKSVTNNNDTNTHHYDWVQRTAYKEGICIPRHLQHSFRVFSSAEAIDCLSSKTTLVLSGDSYMQQMFFGVADILLSKAVINGKEFRGKTDRRKALIIVQKELDQRRNDDPCFPRLLWATGDDECYGLVKPFSERCSNLINSYTTINNDTVAVVGSMVHLLDRNSLNTTIQEIQNFLTLTKQTVWVSGVSHQIEKVPEQYKLKMANTNYERGYNELLQNLAPMDKRHPYLDVWQMTSSCIMDKCSYDGHHRSRFVNRWKAQMLLNTICEKLK